MVRPWAQLPALLQRLETAGSQVTEEDASDLLEQAQRARAAAAAAADGGPPPEGLAM